MHRPTDGRSQVPLLFKEESAHPYDSSLEGARPPLSGRRSTFRSITPGDEENAMSHTRRKYTYAGFFLLLSLVSFVIQTETAIYIQHVLGWKKAYSMLSVSLCDDRRTLVESDCGVDTSHTVPGHCYGPPSSSSSAYKNARCPGEHSGDDIPIFSEQRHRWWNLKTCI